MHLTDFSRHVILVAVTAAVMSIVPILTSPSAAHACSCEPARDWGFLGPVHGRLPANAAGVLWFQPNEHILRNERLESRFTIEILERSTFRKLPVRVSAIDGFSDSFDGMYVVAPFGEGLQPGATYRFSGDRVGKTPGSGYRQVIVTIDRDTLSETAAFNLEIGAVTNAVIEEAMGGSCSAPLDASFVRIEGRLSQEARHWQDQLLYRTIIDHELHWRGQSDMCSTVVPGRTETGAGHDVVYANCGPSWINGMPWYHGPLEPGRYTLKMEAYLPGAGIILETGIKSVDLVCYEDRDTLSSPP